MKETWRRVDTEGRKELLFLFLLCPLFTMFVYLLCCNGTTEKGFGPDGERRRNMKAGVIYHNLRVSCIYDSHTHGRPGWKTPNPNPGSRSNAEVRKTNDDGKGTSSG